MKADAGLDRQHQCLRIGEGPVGHAGPGLERLHRPIRPACRTCTQRNEWSVPAPPVAGSRLEGFSGAATRSVPPRLGACAGRRAGPRRPLQRCVNC
jgi:hypothetical protein